LPKTGRGAADVKWVAFFPITREIQRQSRRDDPRCLLPESPSLRFNINFCRSSPKLTSVAEYSARLKVAIEADGWRCMRAAPM
jgi:hypothetical protein